MIKDQSQTDHVTMPANLNPNRCPWDDLNFQYRRAMVMTHTVAKKFKFKRQLVQKIEWKRTNAHDWSHLPTRSSKQNVCRMLFFKITVYKRKILQWQPLIWRCRSRICTSKIQPIYLLYVAAASSCCHFLQQVCVQPRISAVNVTLSAFSAERRAATPVLLSAPAAGTRRRALSSKPAGHRCCCGSTGQTDGQTDGRPLHGPTHHASNVKKELSVAAAKSYENRKTIWQRNPRK